MSRNNLDKIIVYKQEISFARAREVSVCATRSHQLYIFGSLFILFLFFHLLYHLFMVAQSLFLKKIESELQNKTESQFRNKRESHFQNKTKSQF